MSHEYFEIVLPVIGFAVTAAMLRHLVGWRYWSGKNRHDR